MVSIMSMATNSLPEAMRLAPIQAIALISFSLETVWNTKPLKSTFAEIPQGHLWTSAERYADVLARSDSF